MGDESCKIFLEHFSPFVDPCILQFLDFATEPLTPSVEVTFGRPVQFSLLLEIVHLLLGVSYRNHLKIGVLVPVVSPNEERNNGLLVSNLKHVAVILVVVWYQIPPPSDLPSVEHLCTILLGQTHAGRTFFVELSKGSFQASK